MDGHERTAAIQRQKQSADRPAEHLWVADEWKDFPVWRVPDGPSAPTDSPGRDGRR